MEISGGMAMEEKSQIGRVSEFQEKQGAWGDGRKWEAGRGIKEEVEGLTQEQKLQSLSSFALLDIEWDGAISRIQA